MALSIPEAAWYFQRAGFTGSALITITAIAVRESSLVPDAGSPAFRARTGIKGDLNNPGPGCNSWGLVQINVCPSAGNKGIPYRENPESLTDPAVAAAAAWDLSQHGTNFGPWGMGPNAYRGGVAAPPIAQVEAELAKSGGPRQPTGASSQPTTSSSSGDQGGGGLPDLSGIGKLGELLTDSKTWYRVLLFTLGGGMVIMGALLLAKEQTTRAVSSVLGGSSKPAPDDDDDEDQGDGLTEEEATAGQTTPAPEPEAWPTMEPPNFNPPSPALSGAELDAATFI